MNQARQAHTDQRLDPGVLPRRSTLRSAALAGAAITLAMLLLAACAGHRTPENPDARTCLPPANSAMRDKDYNIRLAGYTHRADEFSACMTAHGYVLDENELDERLTHFEQVKNANVMGGDPIWAKRIEEQVLRTDAELWKRP